MSQVLGQNPTTISLDPAQETAALALPRSSWRSLLSDVGQMTKPRITTLVVATAYIGYEIGQHSQSLALRQLDPLIRLPVTPWWTLPATLLGTGLACMGASAFNQVLERDVDALMHRTMNRPLPAGRISVASALFLGSLLSVLGIGLLLAFSHPLAALLTATTVLSYVFVYTPMKRISSVCTIVGAGPGALPPVIGFAAATGRIGIEAWIMFAILFLWQLPHFLAIAWLYRDDYARAGLPMLPVVDPDFAATRRQILAGCLALLPLGLMPTLVGMSGVAYFIGALLAGLFFLGFGIALVIGRTRRHARALFFASLVYLPLVFALMLIDMA